MCQILTGFLQSIETKSLSLHQYLKNMKRRFCTLLAFCLAICTIFAQNVQKIKATGRPTVAVVLAGGGAKGCAHLGALKVIEESGIPIDIIVGTSMGSIVGGLYSIGYTNEELTEIVQKTDWINLLIDTPDYGNELLTSRKADESYLLRVSLDRARVLSGTGGGGIIEGKNISTLFKNLTKGVPEDADFNKFPIAFACVATDAITGNKYVFHKGNLVTAMRSSMAIPSVFTPVKVGNATLVDGFVVDNFPVDVAIEMGADIVIGVDICIDMTDEQLSNSATDVLMHLMDFISLEQYEENKKNTTIYIPINATGYSAASFTASAIDSLLVRGEVAARAKFDELVDMSLSLKSKPQYLGATHKRMNGVRYANSVQKIKDLIIEETEDEAEEDAPEDLEEAIKKGINFARDVFHSGSLSLGARFDSQEYASIQLGIKMSMGKDVGKFDVDVYGRLGARLIGGISADHIYSNGSKIGIGYSFEHKDLDYYYHGARVAEVGNNHQRFEMKYRQEWRKVGYSFGIRYDINRYRDILLHQDVANSIPVIKKENYFSYFAKAEFNNLDAQYFPTSGTQLEASTEIITSNLYEYHQYALFPILTGSWRTAISFGNRSTLIPKLSGRIVFSGDAPTPFALKNYIGGMHKGLQMEQQLEISGVGFMEVATKDGVGIAGLELQQRFGGNHFIIASVDGATINNNFKDALSHDALHWGTSLGYSFRSLAGPISLTANWSDITKKVTVNLNVGYYF